MRVRDRLVGFRQRVRSTVAGRVALRVLVALIGTGIVLIGFALVPLPGPGWLIVIAGLGILATEFAWARRLLAFTRQQLTTWWRWVGRQHVAVRVLVGIAGLAFVTG